MSPTITRKKPRKRATTGIGKDGLTDAERVEVDAFMKDVPGDPDALPGAVKKEIHDEVRIPVHREHSFRFNVNACSADAEHRFRSS